jgi:alpha-L-rhamnosidase
MRPLKTLKTLLTSLAALATVATVGSVTGNAAIAATGGAKNAATVVAPVVASVVAPAPAERWSPEKANAWMERNGWLRGCNFIPSTAVNSIEMWQQDTFDAATIERELAFAEDAGFNIMRVFLHHVAWEQDRAGFKKRLAQFLEIADRHKIKIMFVFFDDCWRKTYAAGKQPEPIPGKHNSGWVSDPGRLLDDKNTALWKRLEVYVNDVISTFRDDGRVAVWDLYNEPNVRSKTTLKLVKKAFAWARNAAPSQPLTVCVGQGEGAKNEVEPFALENSDVITYHNYQQPVRHLRAVNNLLKLGRPLICTEYLRRPHSTFEGIMPLLKARNIGAINWGLVAGKTNTIWPWGGKGSKEPEPKIWFHDILRKDGSPFSKSELAFLKQITRSVIARNLQVEYLTNPVGLDAPAPRFSWNVSDPNHARSQKQTAYQILVADDATLLDKGTGNVWDSGKVASDQSFLVPFTGNAKLRSGTTYFWKVRVFDKDGAAGDWSAPAFFTTGLFDKSDWAKSAWLKHPSAPEKNDIWFRKKFTLKLAGKDKRDTTGAVKTALAHVASIGYHELYINGKKADDRVLAPALTALKKRVAYVTYDIAPLLRDGDNVIALWTGRGWAADPDFMLKKCVRARFDIVQNNGAATTLATGGDWKCAVSNREHTNAGKTGFGSFGGERVDGSKENPDWNKTTFDDAAWENAQPYAFPFDTQLVSHANVPPSRIIETQDATGVTDFKQIVRDKKTKEERVVATGYKIEFPKNFTGFIELKMRGLKKGDVVTLMSADDPQTVCDFEQRSVYIAAGDGKEEVFRHKFNYCAGRFLNVTGLPAAPKLTDAKAFAVATDFTRTSFFECSNALLNTIYNTDLWTWRATTVEGLTVDCPHRERMGYGEVATATSYGIGFPNYDTGAYYQKIMQDWRDVQRADGRPPHVAPVEVWRHWGGAMWCSAGLNIAGEHYAIFRDKTVLEKFYPSAKAWLDFLNSHIKKDGTEAGVVHSYDKNPGKFLGDWLVPGDRSDWGGSIQARYFNNCVYAMNLNAFIAMSKLLGRAADTALYTARLETLKKHINANYYKPATGVYLDGKQVQQAFALLTGIAPAGEREKVLAAFHRARVKQPFLDMGSSGLPVLVRYLCEHPEENETTAQMLLKTTHPGYGHFIVKGETTWPENWSIYVPSRIHTCFTGIAAWFIKGLAGLRPETTRADNREFIIAPAPVTVLERADASVRSPYGLVTSKWWKNTAKATGSAKNTTGGCNGAGGDHGNAGSGAGNAGGVFYEIIVPPNSRGRVTLPAGTPAAITENGAPLRTGNGILEITTGNGKASGNGNASGHGKATGNEKVAAAGKAPCAAATAGTAYPAVHLLLDSGKYTFEVK